jgi:S-adenosylmethionine decarboxylase proenzyme
MNPKEEICCKIMLGEHKIYDIYNIEPNKINNVDTVEFIMDKIAQNANLHVIHKKYHQFGGGNGVSGAHIIEESHLTIHTWPEHNYAAIDVFVCSKCDFDIIEQTIKEEFNTSNIITKFFERGIIE